MTNRDISERRRAEHSMQIVKQFGRFRGRLADLVMEMYEDHFTENFRESPEYVTILDAVANWEQTALEKYRS